ncbi:MAG TPA: hypothetical protein VM142_06130 [Acidimicrobiales bacterium]|nr:hypothetical protein [Acidimicrobiales bacterium]
MDAALPADGTPPPPGTEGGIAGAARDLVGALLNAVGRAGSFSVAAVGDGIEGPARALAGRIVSGAVNQPRAVADAAALVKALDDQPRSPLLGGATGAALAAKVARRVGPLRLLARRTPLWLLVTAAPALHASIALGAQELALVASHLVHRARAAGLEPDPERVRRASVQLLLGAPVDPGAEPRHAPLAVAWLQRALRAALPFSSGVATRESGPLALAASSVDPVSLGRADEPPAGEAA